jgi:hypothetical protein
MPANFTGFPITERIAVWSSAGNPDSKVGGTLKITTKSPGCKLDMVLLDRYSEHRHFTCFGFIPRVWIGSLLACFAAPMQSASVAVAKA